MNDQIYGQAFEACLQILAPKLAAARTLGDDLLRPFRCCHRTWKYGAVAIRQELTEVSNRWQELSLPDSCPYPEPEPKDLTVHKRDHEEFIKAQKLKGNLMSLLEVPSDGWVPADEWEATKLAHKEAFDEIYRAVGNPDITDE